MTLAHDIGLLPVVEWVPRWFYKQLEGVGVEGEVSVGVPSRIAD